MNIPNLHPHPPKKQQKENEGEKKTKNKKTWAGERADKGLMMFRNFSGWTSLVAQWLRIRLPMQGTRVRALVWEDPTCCGTTKPVRHNYWACALKPTSHNYWAHVPQLLKPTRSRARAPQQRETTAMRSLRTATKHSPRSPQLEKARAQQRRPNTAKNK